MQYSAEQPRRSSRFYSLGNGSHNVLGEGRERYPVGITGSFVFVLAVVVKTAHAVVQPFVGRVGAASHGGFRVYGGVGSGSLVSLGGVFDHVSGGNVV